MDTPPVESSLAFTVSWNSGGRRRQAAVSFGAAIRVALVLSLCVGCFELGRWRARLEAQSEGRPDSRVVIVDRGADKPARPETVGFAAGGPSGSTPDVITPLDVRDPTALVMGPGATDLPPKPAAAPPPAGSPEKEIPDVAPPAKVYKKAKDIKPNQRF